VYARVGFPGVLPGSATIPGKAQPAAGTPSGGAAGSLCAPGPGGADRGRCLPAPPPICLKGSLFILSLLPG
jgi:hypothetical protein